MCGHLRRFGFLGCRSTMKICAHFSRIEGLRWWPAPLRCAHIASCPFLGCPESITQVYGARSYTYDSPLANWQHMVRSEGLRKVRGWQIDHPTTHPPHHPRAQPLCLCQSQHFTKFISPVGIINSHRNHHHHHQSSQFSGDIWMVDSPGCPRVSRSRLNMCVTYVQPGITFGAGKREARITFVEWPIFWQPSGISSRSVLLVNQRILWGRISLGCRKMRSKI